MHVAKAITINGKPLGSGRFPAICTPLIGSTREKILEEVAFVVAMQPDVLEWRVDFYEGIGNASDVVALAREIRELAHGIPVLFTRRSIKEGGEPIGLTEEEVVALVVAVCASGTVEMVDFEMNNNPDHIARVRAAARQHGLGLVLSFHNFQSTPSHDTLCQYFAQAQALGADVAKIAVMPQRMEDVLTLLSATLESSHKLGIPLVSMSMGGYGALTRLFGWTFGSAMTFVVGAGTSAPGQVPIADMQAALEMMHRALAAAPKIRS